mmetsp:Transcript_8443/g.23411  ORF Transcript_8443/g.23411 Transcript_8443/m.23411 type:complete len:207 (-) Transcript_8443:237-857(-)
MSSSLMEILTSPSTTGEAMSREDRNCEDIFPLMDAVPPFSPFELMVTGGHPVSSIHLASAPSCCNPSIKSAIGRSRILGTPSKTNFPCPMHNAAANGRMAVPAFPKKSSTTSSGLGESMGPACPVTVTDSAVWRSTGTSSVSRASSMKRMSSDSSRLSTRVSPWLKAAKSKQRLLRDLDPGSVTVPSKLLMGVTVRDSVSFSDAVA